MQLTNKAVTELSTKRNKIVDIFVYCFELIWCLSIHRNNHFLYCSNVIFLACRSPFKLALVAVGRPLGVFDSSLVLQFSNNFQSYFTSTFPASILDPSLAPGTLTVCNGRQCRKTMGRAGGGMACYQAICFRIFWCTELESSFFSKENIAQIVIDIFNSNIGYQNR